MKLAIKVLRVTMEDQINETKFEMGVIEQKEKKFKIEENKNLSGILKKI